MKNLSRYVYCLFTALILVFSNSSCSRLKKLNPALHCIETRSALKLELKKIVFIKAKVDTCNELLIRTVEVEEHPFNFSPFLKNKYSSANFKLNEQALKFIKAKASQNTLNLRIAAAPVFKKNFHTLLIPSALEQIVGRKIVVYSKEQDTREYFLAYRASLDELALPQVVWYVNTDKNILLIPDGSSLESIHSDLTPRALRERILAWKGSRGNSPYPIGAHIAKKSIQYSTDKANKDALSIDRELLDHQKVKGMGPFHELIALHGQMKESPYSLFQLEQLAKKRITRNSSIHYQDFDVESLLLILGYMRALGIHSVEPLKFENRSGILFHSALW